MSLLEKTRSLEVIFNLGCILGDFSKSIEVANLSERQEAYSVLRKFVKIKVLLVLEQLKEVNEGLAYLDISKETQKDIELFSNQLTEKYGIKLEEEKKQEELLLTKLKTKIKTRKKEKITLKHEDIKELSPKLNIWKDRIKIELNRLNFE